MRLELVPAHTEDPKKLSKVCLSVLEQGTSIRPGDGEENQKGAEPMKKRNPEFANNFHLAATLAANELKAKRRKEDLAFVAFVVIGSGFFLAAGAVVAMAF